MYAIVYITFNSNYKTQSLGETVVVQGTQRTTRHRARCITGLKAERFLSDKRSELGLAATIREFGKFQH